MIIRVNSQVIKRVNIVYIYENICVLHHTKTATTNFKHVIKTEMYKEHKQIIVFLEW